MMWLNNIPLFRVLPRVEYKPNQCSRVIVHLPVITDYRTCT